MLHTLLLATALFAQTPPPPAPVVKNPTLVTFTCADHDRDTQHELDIINVDGAVVQTLLIGDPPADADGVVHATINVQPVAFGSYTVKVRAVAGDLKSDDSVASAVWQRVPGAPSKPSVR